MSVNLDLSESSVIRFRGHAEEQREDLMEVASRAYEEHKTPKFKVALAIIHIVSVFIRPFVLGDLRDNRNRWSYIFADVSYRFRSVSRDRGEELGLIAVSQIAHKFLRLFEQFGPKVYKSHLEYELNKYREEGIRTEYLSKLESGRGQH